MRYMVDVCVCVMWCVGGWVFIYVFVYCFHSMSSCPHFLLSSE